MRKLRNWFYKDSHLLVKKISDGGLISKVKVNMLTFSPYNTIEKVLENCGDTAELTGTYGLNPWDIFNPFKQSTNIVWIMMYQQGLIKDVTAELIHPRQGSMVVTVNNPQIGQPYAVFYNSPIEAVIPSPLVGTKIYLNEGETRSWTNENGWTVGITRNNDTDNKEFILTFR